MQIHVQEILSLLSRFDPVVVYQFGSTTAGSEHPESDLDLAFFSQSTCDPYDVFLVAQDIAGIVGRDVDLIDLDRASDVLKTQVIGNGRRLLVTDQLAVDTLEMLSLSSYARLNEERREVLEKAGVAAS